LVQVKQNSSTFCRDPAQRRVELRSAVTTRGTQNIARKALRVNAHEHVLPISDVAAYEGDVCLFVDLILECVKTELSVCYVIPPI
jgi:hypothetical protein